MRERVRAILLVILILFFSSCYSYCYIPPPHTQMFGVREDGVEDDYYAIQKVLDCGGNIYFPPGVYRVGNTLHVIQSHTHLKIHH